MKKLFFLAALFVASVVHAKDHVIVIKSDIQRPIGKTEVKEEESTLADTLTVVPAKDIEVIQVAAFDEGGNVLSQSVVSANSTQTYSVSVPSQPIGFLLEIRDEKGIVYQKYEYNEQ